MKSISSIALIGFVSFASALPQATKSIESRDTLPTVDLGREFHQASVHTTYHKNTLYTFSNIRYAQAPVGKLRWQPPVAPSTKAATPKVVNTGSQGATCAQANPAWLKTQEEFMPKYLTQQNISEYIELAPSSSTSTTTSTTSTPKVTVGADEAEDCLFLDVVVPSKIFDSASSNTLAPVFVWLYGGGYTSGSKTSSGSSDGIIDSSITSSSEGMIFVALNYRIGLFGFLASSSSLEPNGGLLDQRLALQWVQNNIHLFGGDKTRVTLAGESAGGGSVMHHITSPEPALFSAAIPQSPAYEPFVPEQAVTALMQVMQTASLVSGKTITTPEHLRALSFDQLYAVNSMVVGKSPYGTFTFGPVPLGSYVPDLPIRRLTQGKYNNISILAGHNANEGLLFTPPFVQNNTLFLSAVENLFPTANQSFFNTLLDLYPAPGTKSTNTIYLDNIARTAQAVSDFLIGCNAHYMSLAMGYGYVFTIPPAIHGMDVGYTFFNPSNADTKSAAVATAMQSMLTAFVTGGGKALENMGMQRYSSADMITTVGTTFGERIKDPEDRTAQCAFWAQAAFLPQTDTSAGVARPVVASSGASRLRLRLWR